MDDDDPISNALRTRRLPHGRSKARGTTESAFNVLRAINEYEITIGTGASRARQRANNDHKSILMIHGLTPAEDGLFATLHLANAITGVAVLAGSRKGLQHIIGSFEAEEHDGDGTGMSDESLDEHGRSENQDRGADAVRDCHDGNAGDEEEDDEPSEDKPLHESSEDRENRLVDAFAKNSFRNPKFWMRWKGNVQLNNANADSTSDTPTLESGMAYIIFTGNSSQALEGTLSCSTLGWKNKRIYGNRIKSLGSETLDLEKCKNAWIDGMLL